MRTNKLQELLAKAFANNIKVLITGAPGIGKTAIVKQVTTKLGYHLRMFHPAVDESVDYKGFPTRDGDKGIFLPFGNLHELTIATEPTVAFFDDLGMGDDSVLKACMQLFHGGNLNGMKISDQVVFCAATNDVGQMSGVTGLLEPIKSRFHTIVKAEVHYEDWVDWANGAKVDSSVIAYIRNDPQALHEFKPTRELVNTPCPRNWEHVSDLIKADALDQETCNGAVGIARATTFIGFQELIKSSINVDAVLLDPTGSPIPERPDLRYYLSSALAARAKRNNFDAVHAYSMRMPQQFRTLIMKDAQRMNGEVINTRGFQHWLTTEGKDLIG